MLRHLLNICLLPGCSRKGAKDATNEAVSASSTGMSQLKAGLSQHLVQVLNRGQSAGSPKLLLVFRALVAVWSLGIGSRQLLAKGPIVLKFYTVW